MTKEHLDGVYIIETECFSHPWSRQSLEEELNNETSLFLVAKEEGEVIGYEFVRVGKMLEDIRHGKTPDEAYKANIGNYGRFANAAKYIGPREE